MLIVNVTGIILDLTSFQNHRQLLHGNAFASTFYFFSFKIHFTIPNLQLFAQIIVYGDKTVQIYIYVQLVTEYAVFA